MMRSLWTAATGMRAQQTNVDTIANNLANVNTTSYKTQEASFKSLLYQNLQSTSTNNVGEEKPVSAEVGLGTRVSAITSSFKQGALMAANNPFSLAIQGDGFFQIKNADGDILYTRDGNLNVSPTANGNMLVTQDGYPVLDQRGNNIYLPVQYAATQVSISDLGVVGFPGPDENIQPLISPEGYEVTLAIYQFNNPAGLEKAGSNNYSVSPASGNPISEVTTANIKRSKINQFFLEGSNVDVANEMVNLIVAQRAYEMNSKAIQASDDMMQQANSLRR